MTDTPAPPTQAALGLIRAGTIRNDIAENVQPDASGIIAPLQFQPPGGTSGWQRVRISNYTPYLFQVIGVPGGGSGDPPQMLQPFQSNVWNYYASRGTITLMASEPGSPLAVPPLRFAYGEGTATGDLLFNFVTIEWTDTPELFFGYYPVPLTGIAINVEALRTGEPSVIPVGDTPVAMAFNQATRRLYVANSASHTLTVIDDQSNTVLATLPLGFAPTDVAVDDIANRIYVAVNGNNDVIIIDGPTDAIVGAVDVGASQTGITCDAVSHRKYVSLAVGNAVAVLDAFDVHTGNVAVGVGPRGIACDITTAQVYVANKTAGTVTQIDEATDLVVGIPIVVGVAPTDVAVDSFNDRIYVANDTGDSVSVIDGNTALVIATTAVGNGPIALACAANETFTRNRLYVANNTSNSVSVLNETTDLVIDTLAPGVGPTAIAVNTDQNKVYVAIAANAVVVLNGV